MKSDNHTKKPTVIFFHENAGNIGTRLSYLKYYISQSNVNVLLVAYRGYSDSEGSPNEAGIMLDGEAILKFAFDSPEIDSKQVFVHGRSLGGAVAISTLASKGDQYKVRGVIIENSFTSMPDMVDALFGPLAYMKWFILKNYWPSLSKIHGLTVPMLFISCKNISRRKFWWLMP